MSGVRVLKTRWVSVSTCGASLKHTARGSSFLLRHRTSASFTTIETPWKDLQCKHVFYFIFSVAGSVAASKSPRVSIRHHTIRPALDLSYLYGIPIEALP